MDMEEPDWQEEDQAIRILEVLFEEYGIWPTRAELLDTYLKLRKLAIDARIPD